MRWHGVCCLHNSSPMQYSNRAPHEPWSVSWGHLILNNWILLCCFPGWEQNLKPPCVFLAAKIQFYEMIGSWRERCKAAQAKTKPFFSLLRLPSLLRFCFHIWSPDSALGNWEATWNLKSHWKTGLRQNIHRVCVGLFTVREVFPLPHSLTLFKLLKEQASDTNLLLNWLWLKFSTTDEFKTH